MGENEPEENITECVLSPLPPGVEVFLGHPGDEIIRIDEAGAGPVMPEGSAE